MTIERFSTQKLANDFAKDIKKRYKAKIDFIKRVDTFPEKYPFVVVFTMTPKNLKKFNDELGR